MKHNLSEVLNFVKTTLNNDKILMSIFEAVTIKT